MSPRPSPLRSLASLTAALLVVACVDASGDTGATADASSGGPVEHGSTGDTTTGEPTTGDATGPGAVTIDPPEPPEPPALTCTRLDVSPQRVATIPASYFSLAFLGDTMLGTGWRATDLIDITDPTDPILSTGDDWTSPDGVFLTVDDGRIFLHDGGAIDQLEIRDSQVRVLGRMTVTLQPERFTVAGDVAYGSNADAIAVLDISDLHEYVGPAKVLTELPGAASGLLVADGHLFAAADTLRVFSIADPKAPVLVAKLPLPNDAREVARHGDHLYIASSAPGTLYVVDVADPAAPALVGEQPIHAPRELTIAGGFAFLSDDLHLHAYDLSDPTNPAPVVTLELPPDGPVAFAVRGEFLYVSPGGEEERTDVYRLCASP